MDLNTLVHEIGAVRAGRTELETTPIRAAINRGGVLELAGQ